MCDPIGSNMLTCCFARFSIFDFVVGTQMPLSSLLLNIFVARWSSCSLFRCIGVTDVWSATGIDIPTSEDTLMQ